MDIDLSQYMGAYIDGSRENLDLMDRVLLILEQNPQNLDAIEDIFRAAHTLKGMSATMGFEKVAHLTHEMENVLDKIRIRKMPVSSKVIDVVFEVFDVLRILVNDSIAGTDSNVDLGVISQKLATLANDGEVAAPAPVPINIPVTGNAQVEAQNKALFSELAEFQITEYEIGGLSEAQHEGLTPYLLEVRLVADCLLKGPRVFMVMRSLDSLHCEILRSIPDVKDLENEKFDRSFRMIVTCQQAPQEIIYAIESISEIEAVLLRPFSLEVLRGDISVPSVVEAPPPSPPPSPTPAPQPITVTPKPTVQEKIAVRTSPPPTETKMGSASQWETPKEHSRPQVERAPDIAQSSAPVAVFQAPVVLPGEQDVEKAGLGESESTFEDQREIIEIEQLVSFRMAGETYALNIAQVEGIINLIPITRVPKAPAYIEGVINMRGEIVPVINLRRRLQLTLKERIQGDQIVILAFEKEKVKVGFLVDGVHEVIRLPKSSIESPSRVSENVDVEYLNGVGKIGSKLIILLNAHRIVFGNTAEIVSNK
ncbi:MAG: chemotaxis protein CheW [Candidatus Riflebacteria bacterium]|nr:chemotaxis protein CheW [Candidatus Riflebacteria bacterium]